LGTLSFVEEISAKSPLEKGASSEDIGIVFATEKKNM
jgi:hypothetical protein